MNQGTEPIEVSIGVCTGQGWPEIEPYVRSYETAAAAAGGEVVVADGSGRPPPLPEELAPHSRWLSFPRTSVYELRPTLLDACRGRVIALTEDHCRVDPAWATTLLAVHREQPRTLVVGGPVENAATEHVVDWASYFVVQVGALPPVRPGPRRRLAHANVSYKRSALGHDRAITGLGSLDSLHQAALRRHDGAIHLDPRPVVWHDQSLGTGGFLAQHFHAGRTYGGFVRAQGGLRPIVRLAIAPILPYVRLARAVAHGARSRHAGRVASAVPLMFVLLISQMSGQLTGILLGPGDSPFKVEG